MNDARSIALGSQTRAAALAALWRTVVVLFKLRIVVLLLLAAMGGAFLGAGSWKMDSIGDGRVDRDLQSSTRRVTANDSLEFSMRPRGGFIARIYADVNAD